MARGLAATSMPDNITVTPRGGLIVCEDDASSAYADAHELAPGLTNVNRLIGLTPGGEAFEGMTCAVTGPWRRGPL